MLGALAIVALLSFSGDLRRGVYVLGFSALIGTAALVIGITALRKARRTDVYRPRGAIGAIFLGAMAMLLTMPVLATYALFPAQVGNYLRCLSQAQSSSAQQACVNQFVKSINSGKP